MTDAEIPLSGGNTNASVVRVGDTVRRSPGPSAAVVHRFLTHLEEQQIDDVPRFLGIDPQGREVLTYLPGNTQMPDTLWQDDAALDAAAGLLRSIHDASVGFVDQPGWASAHPNLREVICHNDFAPYNMVFADGLPVGIFDFDLAGPGPRLRDLAYLAYWMVPLSFAAPDLKHHTQHQAKQGYPRLRRLCVAYGTADHEQLLHYLSEVLHHMGNAAACAGTLGDNAVRKLDEGGHFAHWQAEAAAFDTHLSHVRACLS
ncbi:aminoglycoside phosphotransferase family protein [Yoonia sp. SS1-5]|uniref:Aminoglycoside phosphotransferase family protein n=1 Tax=Yoonia rhodophyticola TaxID=3137370 RepID=A0AAN0NJ48_9RHOB